MNYIPKIKNKLISTYFKSLVFLSNLDKKLAMQVCRIANDRNGYEWARLKNLYKGECGFVIGNGPSLTIEDLERLKSQISIASNKVYLIFDRVQWRPTIFTVVDGIVAENNTAYLANLPLRKYFSVSLKPITDQVPNVIYWRELPGDTEDSTRRRFSKNAIKGLCSGHTVTYNNLQIAYHLGLETVYLIGVDFSFNVPEEKEEYWYGEALVSEGEVNHFIPEYREPGEKWTMPDLERQEIALRSAKIAFEEDGRTILNATRGGKLELFDRFDLDEVFRKLRI